MKKMGNLALGLTPKSLKLKALNEKALIDAGFDSVRAKKIAKGLKGGYDPKALSKKEAVAAVKAWGKAGIFKHTPKNVLGKVNSFVKNQAQEKDKLKIGEEAKTKRIKAQRRMDEIMADNKKPVTEPTIKAATPTYIRPAFAETPLPVNHEHDKGPDALLNPFGATPDQNNNYEIYQPLVKNKTEDKTPIDLPID